MDLKGPGIPAAAAAAEARAALDAGALDVLVSVIGLPEVAGYDHIR
jgi:hypothetical protein